MSKLQRNVFVKCVTLLSILIFTLPSFAINGRTTYQAKIVKPDGHPLEASNVNFRFTVLDQTGSCVLYVEDYAAINMTDTGGLISFPLGTGARSFPSSGTSQTFQNTFDNSITSFACQAVGIYNPNPTDTRKIVMQFNDGGGWQTLPAMSLNAVPYAMFATRSDNSRALNGKADTAFVEYSSIPTCGASQALQYTGSSFACVTSGGGAITSSSVTTALGYSPVAPASVTALTSSLSTTDATVASVSNTVYSVSSTVSGLTNTVSSLSSTVAASLAAITSSQWTSVASGIYYNGGNVAVGTVSSTDEFLIYKDQDAGTKFRVRNPSSGTAAFAQVTANSDVATTYMFAFGSSYTTTGRFVAGSGLYDANGFGGLGISASNPIGEIRFYTNAHNERMRITSLGNLGLGTSSPVTKLDVSGGIRVSMETASCAANFAGTIRYNSGNLEYCNGTNWAALGVAGAGITSLNSSTSGSQTFATGITGTVFNISSSNGVHTFNIPLAASGSVTAGLLSNADYVTFSNKVTATSASVNAALGYTAANQATVATSFTTLTSTVTNHTTSLTNLVTSMGAIVSSQWVTSGTNIYNSLNNVGIGVTNPTYKLQVSGGAILAEGAGGYYQVGFDTADSSLGKVSFHPTSRNWTNQYFAGLAYSNAGGWMSLGGGTSLNLFLDSGSGTSYGNHIFRKIGWDGSNRTFTEMMRLDTNGNLGLGTTTPTGKVTVNNTTSASYSLDIINANPAIGSVNKAVNINMSAGNVNQTNTGIYMHNAGLSDGSAIGLDLNLNARNDSYGIKINSTKYWGGSALFGTNTGIQSTVGTDSSFANSYAGYFTNTSSAGAKAYGLFVNASAGASDAAPLVVAAQGSEVFRVSVSGGVGVGVTNPTAKVHLAAGTTTNAPLKFNSGTLLTSPQSGTMEYDGVYYYLTDGTNQRRTIATGSSTGSIDNVSTVNSTGNMTLNPAGGTGSVIVSSTTNSTSTNTGALVVNGGAGISGNLNVGGVISGSSQVKATGYRANQGAPDAADSSTVGYAFGLDGDTGLFSPGSGAANGVLAFYNNNIETVRIVSESVGVGVTTPLKSIHVVSGSMVGTTAGFPATYATVHNEFNSGFLKKWTETSGNQVNVGTYSLVAPASSSTKSSHSLVNILFTDIPAGVSATGSNNSFYNFAFRNRYAGNTDRGYVGTMIGIRNEYGHQNDVPGNTPTTNQMFGALFAPQLGSGSINSLYDIYLASLSGAGTVGQHYSIYQESTVAKNYFGASTGFGTSAPQKLVHVSGTGANGLLLDNGTADSTNLVLHDSSQGVSGVTWNLDSANGLLRIFTEPVTAVSPLTTTAGNERMVFKPNGNIGINNINPSVRLDVRGPNGDPSNFVSGTISVNNGGVAALLFGTDDTVSGTEYAWIQSHGSRPVFINKAGNNTILNYGSGYVGIATSAPTERLEISGKLKLTDGFGANNAAIVYGSNTDYLFLGPQSGSSNQGAAISIAGASNTVTGASSGGITFVVPGLSPAAVIRGNTGYVGIGTANPQGSLQIVAAASQSNAPGTGIFLGKSLGNDYQIQLTQSGGTPHIDFSRGGNADYDARISNPVNNSLWLGTTSSSALLALNGLNVGIGTVTPTNKFEVRGGDTFMEGRAYVYSNSGWGAITPSISLAIGDNDTGLNWVSDGVLQIYANNAPRMHFAVTGATGIGRTDPTYSLDVAGTFRVTGQAYTDTGAATFTVLSDVRYKDVHGAYERGLDDLLKIGTIRYNYKKENPTGADPTHEYVGVAAQNVQEAIPEAVEKQTSKEGKEFLTVNPSPIIFAMINGFRDMYNKVVKLIDTDARHDREIASLKAENEELKSKVKEFDELKQYICSKDPQAPNCK